MIRILHTGDIHPNNGATFAGRMAIDPSTGQNQALTDLEKSLEYVTNQAFRRQTHLALLAGDLFDSPKPHPNEIRIIRNFVRRLAAMMQVVAIPGNHDMSQNPNDNTALEAIKGIDHVHVIDTPTVLRIQIGSGHDVQIACLPYPTKGRLLTQDAMMDKSPEEVTAAINAGLAKILRDAAAQRDPNAINILLAHGSVANAQISDQPRSIEHDILIPRDDFGAFHYVALGHIHRAQAVADNAHYCGSLMRQSFGEETDQKGCTLVTIDGVRTDAGNRYEVEQIGHIENPHARTYTTITDEGLTYDNALAMGPLDPETVWRFKACLTEAQENGIKVILDEWTKTTPWFQIAIERLEEDRSRDAGMTGVMSAEEALARALQNLPSAQGQDHPAILDKHRAIEQATR